MSDVFKMPELNIGDMVLWYSDPLNPQDPSMGWVARRPGVQTISILIWAEDAGLIEKPSVRHVDDPFWLENQSASAWTKWGGFRLHPSTQALKQVAEISKNLKLQAARAVKPKDAA
jgi:hypothetical protein